MPHSKTPAPRGIALLLAALAALGPFSIDTYLPSFNDIGSSLLATPLQVQQTLTAYLLPFALMTLWHGAFSDFGFTFGMSMAMPCLTLQALDLFPEQRGLAASCQTFLQSAFDSVAAGLLAPALWASTLMLALGMGGLMLLGAIAISIQQRRSLACESLRSPATGRSVFPRQTWQDFAATGRQRAGRHAGRCLPPSSILDAWRQGFQPQRVEYGRHVQQTSRRRPACRLDGARVARLRRRQAEQTEARHYPGQ